VWGAAGPDGTWYGGFSMAVAAETPQKLVAALRTGWTLLAFSLSGRLTNPSKQRSMYVCMYVQDR